MLVKLNKNMNYAELIFNQFIYMIFSLYDIFESPSVNSRQQNSNLRITTRKKSFYKNSLVLEIVKNNDFRTIVAMGHFVSIKIIKWSQRSPN